MNDENRRTIADTFGEDIEDMLAADRRVRLGRIAEFADPGGNSALRRATKGNPRNLSCPTCKRRNVLTPADRAKGYQCDRCADRADQGFDG